MHRLGRYELVRTLGMGGRGPVVVVLDNFEQIREHAGVVARRRARAPDARLVVKVAGGGDARAALAEAEGVVPPDHPAASDAIARARALLASER